MKKKTKKNLHVDTPTVSFKDYVNGSKEFEFIKMAKNGAKPEAKAAPKFPSLKKYIKIISMIILLKLLTKDAIIAILG